MKKKIAVGIIILVSVILSIVFCLTSLSQPEQDFEINGETVDSALFELQPRLSELVKRLQIIDSSSVYVKYIYELDIILDRGKLYNAQNHQLVKGEPDHCYKNCMALWLNDSSLKYVSGYGLSDEGWIMHAWIINGSTLVETTYLMDIYFGAQLTTKEILLMGIYKGLYCIERR